MTQTADHSILVVNCWDDSNKGDAAITIGLLNTLKTSRAANRLKVSSYVAHKNVADLQHGFRHVNQAHPDVELVPCYFPALSRSIGKIAALLRSFRSVLKLVVPVLIPDTHLDKAVREASVVASNGGLYFGFRPTSFFNMLYHLFAFSYPMLLARRLGVPYVLFAQSFGPFPSALSRWWMRKLVENSAGAWCRESMSFEALKKLGVDESYLKVIPDAAFGIRSKDGQGVEKLSLKGLRVGGYVALSLRSLVPAGFSEAAEREYMESFKEAIEWLVNEKNLQVVLVAHTLGPVEDEDDRITTRQVTGLLSPDVAAKVISCELDLSPQELCTLYGNAQLVIATRFHAVVLSLCGGAPVIAIPYFGIKTQGAFRDLGLSSFVLEVGKMNAEILKSKIASCLDDSLNLRHQNEQIAQRLFQGAVDSGLMMKQLAMPNLDRDSVYS